MIPYLPSDLDYSQFVMVGQTHSINTHHRYYVMKSLEKKRKYEEGTNLQSLFQTLLHQHPLPSSSIETRAQEEEEEKEDREEDHSTSVSSTSLTPIPPPIPFNTTTSGPIGGNLDLDDIFEFGSARADLNKKGQRFEWTEKEINHLKYYIINIEPNLSESERKNKFSTCLTYLKRADASIQQDFHPFHCENSSRLKTGYEVALKRIGYTRE